MVIDLYFLDYERFGFNIISSSCEVGGNTRDKVVSKLR